MANYLTLSFTPGGDMLPLLNDPTRKLVYPRGFETLTFQFMNPKMTQKYLYDTLLVTFTIDPSGFDFKADF
jgi:hypothetical protein